MINAKATFEENYVEKKEELIVEHLIEDTDELIERALFIDSVSKDWKLTNNDITILPDLVLGIASQDAEGNPFTDNLKMTPYSFTQFCSRMGLPNTYAKKLMSIGREDLLLHNLNELLQEQDENKEFLVRQTGNYMRAFLSDRYTVLDSSLILDMAKKVIPENFALNQFFLTPERLHVRYLGQRLDIPKQDLYVGIQIDSSDVGRKNLSVDFFIYKQVCTNGLKVAKLHSNIYKKVHVGDGLNELSFYRDFSKGIGKMQRFVGLLTEEIKNALNNSIDETGFKKLYEKTKKAFPQIVKEDEVKLYMNKYGDNLFAYVNALTEISHQYTLDERIDLEEFAGSLLVA